MLVVIGWFINCVVLFPMQQRIHQTSRFLFTLKLYKKMVHRGFKIQKTRSKQMESLRKTNITRLP